MAKGKAQDNFRAKAPWIMALLMRDFPIGLDDAAAIAGNLGHESGGLMTLQETAPTVKGSRGGYGWAQWTGPRRRAFEAYCARNKLNPAGDRANYSYLFVELRGSEKGAIAAVRKAGGLIAKVKAFEQHFERAGVKHYDSRQRWAEIALDAWRAVHGSPTLPAWAEPKSPEKPVETSPAPSSAPDAGKPVNASPRPSVQPSVALPGKPDPAPPASWWKRLGAALGVGAIGAGGAAASQADADRLAALAIAAVVVALVAGVAIVWWRGRR